MNPLQFIRSAYEVFEERGRVRKLKIFLISGTLLVAWCMAAFIVFMTPKNEQKVHVSAPMVMPSATPDPSGLGTVGMPAMRPSSLTRRHISIQTPEPASYPVHQGGSYTMTIHTTSSASPVVVGGGWRNHTGDNYSSHTNNPSQAIAQCMPSTSAMIMTSLQRLEKHSLSADNTLQNMQQVIEKNGPNAMASRMKKDSWDEYGEDEEPFLDPVGDVAWGLMAVLGMLWCVIKYKKRQKGEQNENFCSFF